MIEELFGLDPAEFNQIEILWSQQYSAWVWGVLGVAFLVALRFFWTSLSRIASTPVKLFLFSLRSVALIALALALLQPRLEFRNDQTLPNHIAVLIDDSKSMSIKSYPEEISRRERVVEFMERNAKAFAEWQTDFKVETYFVSDKIEPGSLADLGTHYQAGKPRTDYQQVFSQLLQRYKGKSLQGVVLLSDGGDLSHSGGEVSTSLLDALSELEGPAHTLVAGANQGFRDLSIENVEMANFGFINQPSRLTVAIGASNMGDKNISLMLKQGPKILATKLIELREDKGRYKVDLEFTPVDLGKQNYVLSVPLFAGEALEKNNRKHIQIKVVRDRIRILHLNGRPSWDSRFLREALASNPKTDLLSFFILRTLTDEVAAPTSELSLIPFPSNLLFTDYLSSFDLVIFQNFRYEPFIDKRYLDNIRKYVENGGAFLMIGGELAFQMGGYDRSVMEDILPVQMNPGGEGFQLKTFHAVPREGFLEHPALQLQQGKEKNRAAWEQMASLSSVNKGLTPKQGSQTLIELLPESGPPVPVLVTWEKGKGRAGALATDSSWNWNFFKVGEGGSGRNYYKFWDRLIAWMIGDPDTQTLQADTDRDRYGENQEALIKFRTLQPDYSPAPGQKVGITITPPGGEPRHYEAESGEDGDGTFRFNPDGEGFYKVALERSGDASGQKMNTGFLVNADESEFVRPQVNAALLKSISELTGGLSREINATASLSDLSFPKPVKFAKINTRVISLWNNWYMYGLMMFCLCLEWLIRRKSGLS